MNERIYTLAEQVGATRWNDELNGNSIDFSPAQFEKFAELIVGECMAMCKTSVGNADYNTGRLHCLENIKEHFGVEE